MIKREASYIVFYEDDNILLLNKGEQYKYKKHKGSGLTKWQS